MSKVWVISDPHFHHANMLKGGRIANRSQFDTLSEMHEAILDGVNAVVKPHHKLYVLGDVTLQRRYPPENLDIVQQLQGHKRLVLGNHDHFHLSEYVFAGFEKVLAMREMAGILFTHIPVHPGQFYRFRGNVHGHTHDSHVTTTVLHEDYTEQVRDPRYVNVCVEPRNYTPISLDELVAHFELNAKRHNWEGR